MFTRSLLASTYNLSVLRFHCSVKDEISEYSGFALDCHVWDTRPAPVDDTSTQTFAG